MDAPDVPPRRSSADVWAEVVLALGLIAGLVVLLSLNLGETAPPDPEVGADEELLRRVVGVLALIAEVGAAVVIGWGVIQALGTYTLRLLRPGGDAIDTTESLRLRLGRILALGLELTLASDILRTAVAPTRADLLTLGAVAILRTLLNLFLEREIREGEMRGSDRPGDDGSERPEPVPGPPSD